MTLDLSPTEVLAGIGVVLALVIAWRAGSRRARRAAEAARAGARLVSLAGRVAVTAAALLGAQWLVIHYVDNTTLLIILLAVPNVIAAHVLTRTLTVTELPVSRRERGGRP
ncbi:hypothetical protein [Haloechinothrix sp. LS1_15]|uniref:hypothetical protein n=1 Tax=Haloechinothrix sp. LS1_15 TaxID=2652248 RepID=UPI002946F959|nr:hypothetical protein [Haloechinothrix sp. LS1_15]MDV6012222.1 hypothetical protein [Haloechinothrix sp. LS1_15]